MKKFFIFAAFVVAFLVVPAAVFAGADEDNASACVSPRPAVLSPISVVGEWRGEGTYQAPSSVVVRAYLTLQQQGGRVWGEYQSTYTRPLNVEGTLEGNVLSLTAPGIPGSHFTFIVVPAKSGERLEMRGELRLRSTHPTSYVFERR